MTHAPTRTALITLLGWLSCTPSDQGGPADSPIRLVSYDLRYLGANGPELRRSAVAVADDGHLAFTTGYHEGSELITMIDSTGQVVARFGDPGEGPGELRGAYYLFFQESTLYVADVFQGRLLQYGMDGAYVGTVPFQRLLIPIGHVRDSVDATDNSPATGPRVLRIALKDPEAPRTLVPPSDTTYRTLVERSRRNPTAFWVGIGSTTRGALLGDGMHYELFAVGDSGTTSFGRPQPVWTTTTRPPDTLTHFGLYSFGLDGQQRVWVVGSGPDGGFVDGYQDTTLVHHEPIDCRPNRWYGMSMSGQWLVILCDADEEDPVEVHLRLYRVIN